MTYSMQPIIKHLFQADTLEDVSRERLEAFVEEYPSFGIGHYLLSRKLQAEDDDRFTGEIQRTNLYFTNPFWLQWLLENTGTNGTRTTARSPTPATPAATPQQQEPVAEVPVISPQEPAAEWSEMPPEEPAAELSELPQQEQPSVPDEPIRDEEPPFILEEPRFSEETTSHEETAPAEVPATIRLSASESLLQNLREAKELRQSLVRMNEEVAPDAGVIIVPEETTIPAEVADTPEITPAPETVPEVTPAPEIPVAPESTPAPEMPVAHEVTASGAPLPDPPPPAAPPLAFEPYHTIDYFASQGIRLTQDENPSDALGKQLKSFTEWLRVMRRLPQKDREIVPDIAAERTIQTIAAHSIEGKEVVTEAMAEVLAKQGMPEKARDIYRKLSLLDPGKNAYFAAKIEQLKIH
jgi:hypothetical protein